MFERERIAYAFQLDYARKGPSNPSFQLYPWRDCGVWASS